MKNLLFSLFFVAVVALFPSCGNKDGVMDRGQKISEVLSQTSVSYDGTPQYTIDFHVVQHWYWDDDELYRIDYTEGNHTYAENLYFDNRHRILRTSVPAYGIRSEFVYDGRELVKTQVFRHDTLCYTLDFVHRDDHVVSVKQTFAMLDSLSAPVLEQGPLHLLAAPEVVGEWCGLSQRQLAQARKRKASGPVVVSYQLDWKDNNVSRIVVSGSEMLVGQGGQDEIRFTYDNKKNPYRECYTLFELVDNQPGQGPDADNGSMRPGVVNFLIMSENNVLSVTRNFDDNPNFRFLYSYSYKDDYPISRQLSYEYHSMNRDNFSESVIAVSEARQYRYVE